MKVVLKIGGSLLYQKSLELEIGLVKRYIDVINKLVDEGNEVSVVVGGGKLAKILIKASNKLDISQTYQDILGVEATRIHALILVASLKDKAYHFVPRSFDEIRKALSTNKIVIVGGLQPGQSTNAVASLIAEFWEADLLINLSNVKKVYDKNPDEHPDARPFDQMTYNILLELINQQKSLPGKYDLFDRVGCEIAQRSKITLIFTDGSKPENIQKIINGDKIGTMIIDS